MNEKPPSTAHLNKEKLAKLFDIGSDTKSERGAVSPDQRKAEMLRDCLAGILPLDQAVSELLPEVFAELLEKIKLFTGQSFAALLADPATDISIIRKIKEFNKTLVDSAPSAEEHDVAAVIYYAAIASALVHHDKRITSFSYASLGDSLKKLVESPWMTPDLADLFQKAIGICQQKDKQKKA
jgi:hypothetical protein